MVPKIFLRSATTEDRVFLRKWTYGVAVVYGALALAVVVVGLGSRGSKTTLEAKSAPAHYSSPALDR
jgi:glucose uptake protein GlcU